MKVALEFKADNSYTYTMTGGGQNARFEGLYALNGRTATMKTTSVNGIDSKFLLQGTASDGVAPQMGPIPDWRAVLSGDSSRLTLHASGPATKLVRTG